MRLPNGPKRTGSDSTRCHPPLLSIRPFSTADGRSRSASGNRNLATPDKNCAKCGILTRKDNVNGSLVAEGSLILISLILSVLPIDPFDNSLHRGWPHRFNRSDESLAQW